MFERMKTLISDEAFNTIKDTKILLIGIGGVGGYTLECLIRSGFINITIVDGDIIDETNINRQIIATTKNIAKSKVKEAKKRAMDINPNINMEIIEEFIDESNIDKLFNKNYDYIIDACDTISTKVLLIKYAINNNIKIISCMGTGNKYDPSKLSITKLNKTYNDPLAKIMRKLLKENNLPLNIPVVWSSELPLKTHSSTPCSIINVPLAAGNLMAYYIINNILKSTF